MRSYIASAAFKNSTFRCVRDFLRGMLLSFVTFSSKQYSPNKTATQSPLIPYPDSFPLYSRDSLAGAIPKKLESW